MRNSELSLEEALSSSEAPIDRDTKHARNSAYAAGGLSGAALLIVFSAWYLHVNDGFPQ